MYCLWLGKQIVVVLAADGSRPPNCSGNGLFRMMHEFTCRKVIFLKTQNKMASIFFYAYILVDSTDLVYLPLLVFFREINGKTMKFVKL